MAAPEQCAMRLDFPFGLEDIANKAIANTEEATGIKLHSNFHQYPGYAMEDLQMAYQRKVPIKSKVKAVQRVILCVTTIPSAAESQEEAIAHPTVLSTWLKTQYDTVLDLDY